MVDEMTPLMLILLGAIFYLSIKTLVVYRKSMREEDKLLFLLSFVSALCVCVYYFTVDFNLMEQNTYVTDAVAYIIGSVHLIQMYVLSRWQRRRRRNGTVGTTAR